MGEQDLLDLGNHAEAAARAFGLHLVADHLLHFAVADDLQYLLSDKDFVILKVDIAPRQPKCLASSQSAIDGKDDGDIDNVLFGVFEQCLDLVHRVEFAAEKCLLISLAAGAPLCPWDCIRGSPGGWRIRRRCATDCDNAKSSAHCRRPRAGNRRSLLLIFKDYINLE